MPVVPPLTDILDLDEVDTGVFEAPPIDDGRARVFGGQLIAQALAAASFTVDGWPCHSLHSYFLLPGKPGRPTYFEVTDLRDGKRFATRQVVGVQRDEPIFQLTASFQADAGSIEPYQVSAPDVPAPESLPDEEAQRIAMKKVVPPAFHDMLEIVWPIEILHVGDPNWMVPEPSPPERRAWFRTRDPLPEYENLHRAALAYASDFLALSSCLQPIPRTPFDPDLRIASLDHSVWFHRRVRADEWLLWSGTSAHVGDGRGLGHAHIFTQAGELVATVAQEGLLHLQGAS